MKSIDHDTFGAAGTANHWMFYAGRSGKVIKPITAATRFVCFVIADFTDNLKKVLRYSVASHPTADGEGFFGVSTEHNASIEVLPYSKILHDAKVRNEAFFRHLGLD